MNFEFLPYQLYADISHFKDNIEYISSDNGVDLYRAREAPNKPLLGIPVTGVNLYFYAGNLITVYIHLMCNPDNFEKVSKIFQKEIRGQGKPLRITEGMVIGWTEQSEFLGLVNIEKGKHLYLYYTLRKYSVFEAEFSQVV